MCVKLKSDNIKTSGDYIIINLLILIVYNNNKNFDAGSPLDFHVKK